jgi:hypothetical protein
MQTIAMKIEQQNLNDMETLRECDNKALRISHNYMLDTITYKFCDGSSITKPAQWAHDIE